MGIIIACVIVFGAIYLINKNQKQGGSTSQRTPADPYPRATPYYREKFLRDERLEKQFEYYDGYLIDVINDINEKALIRMANDCKYAVEYYTDDTVFRRNIRGCGYSEEEIKEKYDKLRCRAPFFEYCAKLCDDRLVEMKEPTEFVNMDHKEVPEGYDIYVYYDDDVSYYTHPDTHAVEELKGRFESTDKNTQTNNNKKGMLRSRILTLENRIKEIYADQYWQFSGDECRKVMLERELGVLREFRRDMYNCDKAFCDMLCLRDSMYPSN